MSCTIQNNKHKAGVVSFTKMGWDLSINKMDTSFRNRAWVNNIFIEFHFNEVTEFMHPDIVKTVGVGNFYVYLSHCFHKCFEKTNCDPKLAHFERKDINPSKKALLALINDIAETNYSDIEFCA